MGVYKAGKNLEGHLRSLRATATEAASGCEAGTAIAVRNVLTKHVQTCSSRSRSLRLTISNSRVYPGGPHNVHLVGSLLKILAECTGCCAKPQFFISHQLFAYHSGIVGVSLFKTRKYCKGYGCLRYSPLDSIYQALIKLHK